MMNTEQTLPYCAPASNIATFSLAAPLSVPFTDEDITRDKLHCRRHTEI